MKTQVSYNGNTYDLEYEEILPSVYVYKNAIPKEWNVVERIENALSKSGTRFAWQSAKVGYDEDNSDYRRCVDFKIDQDILSPRDEYSSDMMDMHTQILDSLKISLEHYKPEHYLNEISYFECINIVRYGKGEYFKVHSDDGDPYRCTVSAVGYPNDDYEGGELWFPKFNTSYKPKAGDLVVFPSSYAYAHSSEPVTDDGVKYSFVIMTDRNSFAHRNDSPTYYSVDYREQHGVS